MHYTIAVRTNTEGIAAALSAINEAARVDIDYTPTVKPITESVYASGRGRQHSEWRLIVHLTRLTDTPQAALWPDCRYHAFLTDLEGNTITIDRFHRHHAVVELAIRDLKEGAGVEHIPSGQFFANAAWLACAVPAHKPDSLDGQSLGDVHP